MDSACRSLVPAGSFATTSQAIGSALAMASALQDARPRCDLRVSRACLARDALMVGVAYVACQPCAIDDDLKSAVQEHGVATRAPHAPAHVACYDCVTHSSKATRKGLCGVFAFVGRKVHPSACAACAREGADRNQAVREQRDLPYGWVDLVTAGWTVSACAKHTMSDAMQGKERSQAKAAHDAAVAQHEVYRAFAEEAARVRDELCRDDALRARAECRAGVLALRATSAPAPVADAADPVDVDDDVDDDAAGGARAVRALDRGTHDDDDGEVLETAPSADEDGPREEVAATTTPATPAASAASIAPARPSGAGKRVRSGAEVARAAAAAADGGDDDDDDDGDGDDGAWDARPTRARASSRAAPRRKRPSFGFAHAQSGSIEAHEGARAVWGALTQGLAARGVAVPVVRSSCAESVAEARERARLFDETFRETLEVERRQHGGDNVICRRRAWSKQLKMAEEQVANELWKTRRRKSVDADRAALCEVLKDGRGASALPEVLRQLGSITGRAARVPTMHDWSREAADVQIGTAGAIMRALDRAETRHGRLVELCSATLAAQLPNVSVSVCEQLTPATVLSRTNELLRLSVTPLQCIDRSMRVLLNSSALGAPSNAGGSGDADA